MTIATLFRAWRHRRMRRESLGFDDHLLDDLGLLRSRSADGGTPCRQDWLRALRPGASCCSITNREIYRRHSRDA